MYKLQNEFAQRNRLARTSAACDALPIIPVRRGALMGNEPSEFTWWSTPRRFAADFRTALATDVLRVPGQWLILTVRLANELEVNEVPLVRTPVVLADTDLGSMSPRAGGESHAFVALDVPIVSHRIDRLRSGKKDTVFLCDHSDLPPFFRLEITAPDVHISDASADTFRSCRGVSLRAATSTPRFANCTDLMLRVRDGNTVDAAPTEEELAATDAHGFTALHHAVEVGNVQAARALIEAGSNIDALSAQSVSPASIAACDSGGPRRARIAVGCL